MANAKVAGTEAERQLDLVYAAVVTAHQTTLITKRKIPLARQEVAFADEALRRTQTNLEAGTGLILVVLVARRPPTKPACATTAVIRYDQAEVDLLAALGLVEEATIAGAPPVRRP